MIYHSSISIKAMSFPDISQIMHAWNYSRPNETATDWEGVAKTDVPVNEFARFQVRMEIPILLREWLVTFRDHVIWARTSRVDDLTSWPIYRNVSDLTIIREAYNRMIKDRRKDQDHFRMHLPLGYMTGISASLSLRSWVKLVKSARATAARMPHPVSYACSLRDAWRAALRCRLLGQRGGGIPCRWLFHWPAPECLPEPEGTAGSPSSYHAQGQSLGANA
jgi:hypothetical protein